MTVEPTVEQQTHDTVLKRARSAERWIKALAVAVAVIALALLSWVVTAQASQGHRLLHIANENHRSAEKTTKLLQFVADLQNPNSPIGKASRASSDAFLLRLVNADRLIHHLPSVSSLAELDQRIKAGVP